MTKCTRERYMLSWYCVEAMANLRSKGAAILGIHATTEGAKYPTASVF